MIENKVVLLDTKDIERMREERFRRELNRDHIASLAQKIFDHGLIHAIVVDKETGRLIAGENRLAAFELLALKGAPCRHSGYKNWTCIPVRRASNPSQMDMAVMELSENLGHCKMWWQDIATGLLRTHAMIEEEEGGISQTVLAQRLGITESECSDYLLLARNLDNAEIRECPNKTTALNILRRKQGRALDALVDNLQVDSIKKDSGPGTEEENEELPFPEEEVPPNGPLEYKGEKEKLAASLSKEELNFRGIHAEFEEFVHWYQGPKFNFIHFDPPYGVGLHKSSTMKLSGRGQYADTKDLFTSLTKLLLEEAVPRICSHSCHLMFWHSAGDRQLVQELLEDAGWRVWPYPLIWHKSCNTGLFPDSTRGPRHTYEMATVASRGDRKIVRLCADSFSGPTTKVSGHESEKPVDMLEHFFTMYVDESTRILDPTGGSGNALRAAMNKGAAGGVFCEVDEYYPTAFNAEIKEKQNGSAA